MRAGFATFGVNSGFCLQISPFFAAEHGFTQLSQVSTVKIGVKLSGPIPWPILFTVKSQ